MKYLRIVVDEKLALNGAREGFFRKAYELRRNGTMSVDQHRKLDRYLNFLDDHIDVPSKFSKSTSKAAEYRETKGICWFKTSANAEVEVALALARLLDDLGIASTVLRTNRIGYVVFEDEVQIVAEPFSDTPK